MAQQLVTTTNKGMPALIDASYDISELTDTSQPIKTGFWVIGVLFGGFLLWAAFAPLGQGIPTEGKVTILSSRKVVQHLQGGIVSEVLVHEGQMVKKGDVLIKLDKDAALARFEEIKQQYLGLRAAEGRILAEKAGKQKVQFHHDLQVAADDPKIQMQMQNQTALLSARKSALNSELQGLEETIRSQQAQIDGYKGILKSRESQLSLIQHQYDNIQPLVAEGYVTQTDQIELANKLSGLKGEITEATSNISRLERTIAELKQRLSTRKAMEYKDLDTEYAQIKLQVDSGAEKYKALSAELKRTEILAPVSGQVIGLQIHTVGAVIQPAQKIMEIVPQNEALILEVKVAPNLIDRVKQGQTADVRFSSFSNTPMLSVTGVVETIADDLLVDEPVDGKPATSYYLARISVTKEGMKQLAHRKLQPGMPLQVIINTGERSLLAYWMHPLSKRIAASLQEE